MKITLYATTSENIKLDKSLSVGYPMEGTLKEQTNIMTPSILIESKGIPNVNYLYIEDFKRYYFIESIEIVRANLFRINAKVDVLMSFRDGIKRTKAIINKSENLENSDLYYDDGTFATKEKYFTEIVGFPTTVSEDVPFYYLTCL